MTTAERDAAWDEAVHEGLDGLPPIGPKTRAKLAELLDLGGPDTSGGYAHDHPDVRSGDVGGTRPRSDSSAHGKAGSQ